MPLNQDPNFWLALGQLANGSTVGQQIGNTSSALMNYNNAQTTRNEALDAERLKMQQDAQARQEQLAQTNKTLEYLNTVDPELAKAVQAGVIDPKTAMTRAWEAQKPKDWKENYMNVGGNLIAPDASGKIQTVYSPPVKPEASPETIRLLQAAGIDPNSPQGQQIIMNRLAPKGLSIKTADGTEITQGPLGGNQGQKNDANRIKEAQDIAASGAEMKQTAKMLRDASANVGYSGPGAGILGPVFDTAEQMGMPSVGKAGARALMDSGSLNVVLSNVAKTKGAVSDKEMSLFSTAAPGMARTPQGNAALIDIIDKMGERQIQRATQMEQWYSQKGNLAGFEQAWGQYVAQNPLLSDNGDGTISAGNATQAQPQNGVQDATDYFK